MINSKNWEIQAGFPAQLISKLHFSSAVSWSLSVRPSQPVLKNPRYFLICHFLGLKNRVCFWLHFITFVLTLTSGSVGNLVKKFFQSSKCSLLDRKSNISKSQFLKIWFFHLHFICLRKQQSIFDHFWANSNYSNAKNREIQPQGLDLGGSTASNWRWSSDF